MTATALIGQTQQQQQDPPAASTQGQPGTGPIQRFPFADLPAEVALMVVDVLPVPTLLALSRTSHGMRGLTRARVDHERLSALAPRAQTLRHFRTILRDGGAVQNGAGSTFRRLTRSQQAELLMQLRGNVMFLTNTTNRSTAVRELTAIVNHLRTLPGDHRQSGLVAVEAALRGDRAHIDSMARRMTAYRNWATSVPGAQVVPARTSAGPMYSPDTANVAIGRLDSFAYWLHNTRGLTLDAAVGPPASDASVSQLVDDFHAVMPMTSASATMSFITGYQRFQASPQGRSGN